MRKRYHALRYRPVKTQILFSFTKTDMEVYGKVYAYTFRHIVTDDSAGKLRALHPCEITAITPLTS